VAHNTQSRTQYTTEEERIVHGAEDVDNQAGVEIAMEYTTTNADDETKVSYDIRFSKSVFVMIWVTSHLLVMIDSMFHSIENKQKELPA
jgi:hypothetical protein